MSNRDELNELKSQLTDDEVPLVTQYIKNVIATRPASTSLPDATGDSRPADWERDTDNSFNERGYAASHGIYHDPME